VIKKWHETTLNQLCDKITDGVHLTPKYTESGVPFLSVKNLTGGSIDFSNTRFISQQDHRALIKRCDPKPEDILYTKVGTTGVAKVIDTDKEFSLFVSVALLKVKHDLIFNRYLEHYLNSKLGRDQAMQRTRGMANKNLVISDIKEIRIKFPCLSEQKRIVAILDEAFAAIGQAIANTEKNLKNARELYERFLNGILTRRVKEWEEKRLDEICEFVRGPFGGSLKKSIFVQTGYAVYEQQHAICDQFHEVRYFIDEPKFKEMKRFELSPGELIMSCSGTMGRVAIVPKGIKQGIINQALLKIRVNDQISNSFLKLWMESQSFQNALQEYSGGAAIQNVASVKVLKEIKIPVPSRSKQDKIVNGTKMFCIKTGQLESIYNQKLKALSKLKQSILHKAFTGELTDDLPL